MGETWALESYGSLPGWASFFLLLGWIVRTWPHWKAKVNEARKIQLDADGKLREDLMNRITSLEAAAVQRDAEMVAERRRCDEQLAILRAKLDGTIRQFVLFQMTVAQAIPPSSRSPEIDAMIQSLRDQKPERP